MTDDLRDPPLPRPTLNRRTFVKASAVAAAAGPWLRPTRAPGRTSDDALRIGLIGCGGRGTGAAAQALNADPGVHLTAMGDVFPDRLASSLANLRSHAPERVEVPEERQFIGFDAYEQVIGSGVDVVLLATPPHFRPAHLEAAIGADKHVFCEKPMAVDAPGVRRVIATAEEARRRRRSLVAGFCWRYSEPERATYRRIHDGAIGDIRSMHVTYHTGPLGQNPRKPEWTDMEWQLRNWYHFTWLSGDHIVEQACHSIDKINWAMQGVMPVRATGLGGRGVREGAESGNAFDHFAVIYEYESGARCFLTCRQQPNCANDNTDYIMGSEGTCYVNGWGPTQVIEGAHPWRADPEAPRRNMYQTEHDELFAAIRRDEPIHDGVWMAQSTMMAIMGRMAAYTGKTITWEQALHSSEDLTPPQYAFGPLATPTVARPGTTPFL